MSLPDIFTYLDFRRFLDDWFRCKKESNSRFSHRLFARRAGLKTSSLLHHVIRGDRNLTHHTSEAFSQAMSLNAEEVDFFMALVQLNQAEDHTERNAAWERISATKRFREARPIEGDSVQYLSRWYIPAIRELAHRSDFDPSPKWIARTLRPRVTETQAKRALLVLQSTGMLAECDGILRPAEGTVRTPHEVAGLAAHNYHLGMLERASDAIEAFPPSERFLGGLTVAIPESLVAELKAELAAFQERLLDLCDRHVGDAERVYQLNTQLFPLSAPIEEEP